MKRLTLVMLVLLLAAMMTAGRCGDDDDDEPIVAGDDDDAGACDNNTAPTLTAAIWYASNETLTAPPTFAEYTGVQVFLTYEDAECNLGGGRVRFVVDDETPQENIIPTDIPCDGAADKQVLGFDLTAAGVGSHTLTLQLVDRCGEASDDLDLPFSLTAYEEPTDDDTVGDDDTIAEATTLVGEIGFYGESTDLAGRPVWILLFTEWLPGAAVPVAFVQQTVPEQGFPFDYEWDLDAAEVAPGDYFVFAFLDIADEDGVFNETIDAVHAPFQATTIIAGTATTQNLTLVEP